ncbi:MAG TPA: CusA/CzcA family heavy metal efflux RND transporter [Polyangia bacterium]|jgi:cobalt-zinc-cadmium resistance protein CzcA|nr:CusA/CzcA family heavy metal efflux RND transporter [Polyangia bacterium]
MIQRLVAFALRLPAVIITLALAVAAVGLHAYRQLDIEAYPNPIPPMIEIITQPDGWSAEEVERYVTVPLETGLNGMLDLEHIRTQSLFGLSDVKCYFSWDVDYYTAQQRVLNRLQFIDLPPNAKPTLSPWSAIGEIYRYRLRGNGYTLADLKTAQDWVLEKQFRQVPGVIDVVGFGGHTKEYHVEIDPYRLKGQGLTLQQVMTAIGNANQNVGGQRLTLGEQSFNVRGIGLIRSVRDIGDVVITSVKGTPVRVRDVAQISVGPAPRLGIVGKDEEPDVVEGIVLMRYGGDSLKTIQAVHDRVEYIRKYHLLPPGMELEPFYDRAKLVSLTTHTVLENLLLGMALVTLVLWLFLGHTRAALLTALNIPLALLLAFIGMVTTGTPANLISLGAVDFGIVIDSTVIMMESIFRHLGGHGSGTMRERVGAAAAEVGPPMFFSTLIIAVAFIPLITMTGVSGVIFSPMAHTYAFAIGGAILLALTLTPVLASRFLHVMPGHGHGDHEEDNWLMRGLDQLYRPMFELSLQRPRVALLIAATPVLLALATMPFMGREFMPKLEEGNFWIRATLPTSISLEQSSRYVGRMRSLVLGCADGAGGCDEGRRRRPEIETVVSQLGRPDDGTDVSGFYNIELFAPLKPSHEWRRGVTKDGMTEEMSRELREAFPGVVFNFSQVIADNVEEATSGVKGENTVKVVGPDLRVNEKKASEIVDVMAKVPGVADLGMFPSLGQPDVRITPDRLQCGRYGLNVGDVEAVVQAAIGGQAVTQVYEGEKHFDLTVRWAPAYRKDLAAIRGILVAAPDGTQVPLGQLASIVQEEGPSLIYREDNRRYSPVKFSVRGRDLASTIEEAQRKIAEQVKLPYDTHLEWAGEINELNETTGRLAVIIPLTLLLIAFLVYSLVKNWIDMLVVLASIPVASSGGVLALVLTGTHFSISAAMGFISIFGIAIQDSLLVVSYAQRLWAEGHDLVEGVRLAAAKRLRAVLMTTFVALLGLMPAAVSHGIGSETQKPLAIVVIGGALGLALLTPRLLQPALLVLAHRRQARERAATTQRT